MMIKDDWLGLYGEGWQSEIVPDAFQHPAKFSRALIRHIYDHAFLEGWLKAGDRVLDPFGGVALGALDAMRLGLDFTGVELESKFVDLGNKNIELWLRRYAPHFPGWGTARLLAGDSRELLQIIGQAEAVVSSPPYSAILERDRSQEGYAQKEDKKGYFATSGANNQSKGYNRDNPSNLGNLRSTAAGYELAVSSPPYAESMEREGGIDPAKSEHISGPHSQMNNSDTRYGSTPGQLGAMPARAFEAAVSSPPYEGTPINQTHMTSNKRGDPDNPNYRPSWERKLAEGYADTIRPYGGTAGQLGQTTGSDFWTAARAIVDQVYGALIPGGYAIFVVKDYVKDKQRVPFSEQWAAMCEAAGFELLHWHRAWLIEDRGTQIDLWGNGHNKTIQRKSFFRRLAEKKGSPRIDFESVLCMRKRDVV